MQPLRHADSVVLDPGQGGIRKRVAVLLGIDRGTVFRKPAGMESFPSGRWGVCDLIERLCLVSCVAKKAPHPAPAKDLYRSRWFVLAREWVERERLPWYILSAKHGLVHPDTSVAPYDETLNSMGVSARESLGQEGRDSNGRDAAEC